MLTGLLNWEKCTINYDYITAFEGFQYQLTMHNRHLGEMFFVTQFIKGLLPEISAAVLSQVPDTMQRATMLARMQRENGGEKGTFPLLPAKELSAPFLGSLLETVLDGPCPSAGQDTHFRFWVPKNACHGWS